MEVVPESRNFESKQESHETLRRALTEAIHELNSLRTQLSQRDSREAKLKVQLQEKERLLYAELSKSQANGFHENHHVEISQVSELKDMLQKKEGLLTKAVQKGLARNIAYNNVLALLSEKENELEEWKSRIEGSKEGQGESKATEDLLSVYQAKEQGQLDLIQQRNLEIGQLRRENESLKKKCSQESLPDQIWMGKKNCGRTVINKDMKVNMSEEQLQIPNQKHQESVRSSMDHALNEVNALREQLRSIEAELKEHYQEKEQFPKDGAVHSQPQSEVQVDDGDLKKMEGDVKEQHFKEKSGEDVQEVVTARQETGDSQVTEMENHPQENGRWYFKKVFQRSWARNVAYHNILAMLSERETELMEWKMKFAMAKETQDEIKALKALLNDYQVKGQAHMDLIQKMDFELEQLRDQCRSLKKSLTTDDNKEVDCGGNVSQASEELDSLVPQENLQVTIKNTAPLAKKKRHNTRRRRMKNDQERSKTITPVAL